MADPNTSPDGRKSLRKSLRKWRDKFKGQKTTSSKLPSRPSTSTPSPTPASPPPEPLPSAALIFEPTTQTVIHSPADPRNRKRVSSAPQISRPTHDRRNTAPADFFALGNTGGGDGGGSSPAGSRLSAKPRFRLSISKRSSRYVPTIPERAVSSDTTATPTATSPSRPPISTTTSAPAPVDHENRRATMQVTTASDIAAKLLSDEEKLEKAAQVIKRDKPKDWLDPGWRDKEAQEAERAMREKEMSMKAEAENMGAVRLRSMGDRESVLKKWEWGR